MPMNCQVVMESFKGIVNSLDLRLKHTRKADKKKDIEVLVLPLMKFS